LPLIVPNRSFTIRIFVPDGDPEGVRVIGRMNWTGRGTVIPREKWASTRLRDELGLPGVYILDGLSEQDDDLPTVYVGEGDCVRDRIDAHVQNKDFWDRATVFTATNGSLNKAHVRWLEAALVGRAAQAARSKLDNGTAPQPAPLSEAEMADVEAFLGEILQILPLIGLRAFEIPRPIQSGETPKAQPPLSASELDTVVVPAWPEGFKKTFLGENCWHAIRISGGMRPKIRYIAAYVTSPESRITHFAKVASIVPYGEGQKFRLVFDGPAQALSAPIIYGHAPKGYMQGSRYTTFDKLMCARTLTDLF
jgi:hypothetical protein